MDRLRGGNLTDAGARRAFRYSSLMLNVARIRHSDQVRPGAAHLLSHYRISTATRFSEDMQMKDQTSVVFLRLKQGNPQAHR